MNNCCERESKAFVQELLEEIEESRREDFHYADTHDGFRSNAAAAAALRVMEEDIAELKRKAKAYGLVE